MHLAVKARESVGRRTMPAVRPQKVRYPQKTHGFLNKAVYQRLSNELNHKTKIFCFEMKVFIHGICKCEGANDGSGYWHDM